MMIVYDCTLNRPGCPLLQAVLGGTEGIANRFPSESWLLFPTPSMRAYPVTREQLVMLVQGCWEVAHSAERAAN